MSIFFYNLIMSLNFFTNTPATHLKIFFEKVAHKTVECTINLTGAQLIA